MSPFENPLPMCGRPQMLRRGKRLFWPSYAKSVVLPKKPMNFRGKKEGKGASKSPKAAVEEVVDLFANDDDDDEAVDLIAMV